MSTSEVGFARARVNVALATAWGKSDVALNLPAVPSISLTLDRLVIETRVGFAEYNGHRDQVRLDGQRVKGRHADRIVDVLDRLRADAGAEELTAWVDTTHSFPTAAGLAVHASEFSALVGAASAALGLDYSDKKLSAYARQASASAARSIYGGFSELPAGRPGDATLAARELYDADYWDVRLVIATTANGPEQVGSTEGMERSRKTSPLYDAWLDEAPRLARKIKRALKNKDLDALGAAMEQSTFSFHACAMSASPSILYWQAGTMAALRTVEKLRDRGVSAWATIEAGPHVKVLCRAADAAKVRRALKQTAGVLDVLVAKPGGPIEIENRP